MIHDHPPTGLFFQSLLLGRGIFFQTRRYPKIPSISAVKSVFWQICALSVQIQHIVSVKGLSWFRSFHVQSVPCGSSSEFDCLIWGSLYLLVSLSENSHPWGQEHRKKCTLAPTSGEKVPGRVHPHAGDPGHQHSLELQK